NSIDTLRTNPQWPDGVYSNGVLRSFSTMQLTGGDLNSNPGFGPGNLGSDYAMHVYGWVTPPESGDYRFFIRSDDGSELWLSSDDLPVGATLIAYETGCCQPF